LPDQSHTGFLGRLTTLPVVTFEAAGDDIAPRLASPLHDGNNVVKGQILSRTLLPAILARVVIPRVYVSPAELYMLETFPDLHVLQKPQHTWQLYAEADASDFAVIFRQYLDLPLVEQGKGTLPGDDIDGLVTGIQN
jgi:hypothetical protein